MVVRRLGKIVLVALALSALIWADIALRARRAFQEGERYMAWHAKPQLQRAYWDEWLKSEEKELAAQAAAKRLAAGEIDLRRELAKTERDERVAESPLKYAVRWYETGVELFHSPPNPWTARSRARLAEARALWRAELAASGLKLEDYSYR